MSDYFQNIFNGIKTLISGMSLSYQHFQNRKKLNSTLQYPHEKWPIPERDIGHSNEDYNLIRSRLHVDIDDCIGCLQCERVCPVDCIKIETIKPAKDNDFDCGLTANDTQKKMIVPRFTIDMSECMYCNLCVYPCPEECIYMVGGPNSEKHDIDYEFSQRDRGNLLYEFGVSTDEEIIAAGGSAYIEKRNKKTELIDMANRVEEMEALAQERAAEAKDLVVEKVEDKSEGPEFNFDPIDEIGDKPTRGIAKRAFIRAIRLNKSSEEAAVMIRDDLKEFKKYSEDYEPYLDTISKNPLMNIEEEKESAEEVVDDEPVKELSNDKENAPKETTAPQEEKQDAAAEDKTDEPDQSEEAPEFNIKVLNPITDRVTRGIAKKTFMGSQKEGKSPSEIADDIQSILEEKDKYTDDVKSVIDSMRAL